MTEAGDGLAFVLLPVPTGADLLAILDRVNELYAKYKRHGLTRTLGSMKEQLICHHVVVAIAAPNKPSWNLDEWRPEVG